MQRTNIAPGPFKQKMNWMKECWLAHRITRKPEEADLENWQEQGRRHRHNPGQNLSVGPDSREAMTATVPLNAERHSLWPRQEWALTPLLAHWPCCPWELDVTAFAATLGKNSPLSLLLCVINF